MIARLTANAQNLQLADTYYRDGKFEKAVAIYKELDNKRTFNLNIYNKHLTALLEMEQYDEAETLVRNKMHLKKNYLSLQVDLGYVFYKKGDTLHARENFDRALQYVKEEQVNAYGIARNFYEKHLLEYALQAYKVLEEKRPGFHYAYQIARIYGEMGDVENMFDTYLQIVSTNPDDIGKIKLYITRLITHDPEEESNIILRKLLLSKLRTQPRDVWNKLLAWLYVQEKEFHKALVQEKAVQKRSGNNLQSLFDIGDQALEDEDYTTAEEAFRFIDRETDNTDLKIQAGYYLLKTLRKNPDISTETTQNAFDTYFRQYGKGSDTYPAQILYADFVNFDRNRPGEAEQIIRDLLQKKLTPNQEARVRMKWADILVFTGAYNKALVIYSRIQMDFRNHPLGQEARYKIARTSYFRGDFTWANIQLKVLKRGTSHLIANDALELSLLIDDNMGEDSIPRALQMYAKADLLRYQNKNGQALDTLQRLLTQFKGNPVEDEAMMMQAKLYQKIKDFPKAAEAYKKIIKYHPDDLLYDDALYYLARLYEEKMGLADKAMEYYEKILLEQPSSIYLTDARKRYRKLRGDALQP